MALPAPVPAGVIDILVNAAVQFDLIPPQRAAMLELGALLADQNGQAARAAGSHACPPYPPPGHEPEMAAGAFRPGAVLAVLDQYEDCSDPAPAWADSAAAQAVTRLRDAALNRMPQGARATTPAAGWRDGLPAYLNHPDYLAALRQPPQSVNDMPTTED